MDKSKLVWIDALRVLATFGVIMIHVSYPIVYQYGRISSYDWFTANMYDSLARFCVPIFLMVSGALILPKTYDNMGVYLKKRVIRIIYPFLFWSIIYIIKEGWLAFQNGAYMTVNELFIFIFEKLKNGASFHLWYVYMIIGLYLFFPVIGRWINNSNKYEIRYFLGIWLIATLAGAPLIKNVFPNLNMIYFSGYIGYPVLGYYLNRETTFIFVSKKVNCLLLILAGIAITIFGNFFATKFIGDFNDDIFNNYLRPNVIFVSVGIFMLFRNFIKFDSGTHPVILFFSKYSYGTYLVHMLVLWGLSLAGFSYAFINPLIGIPVLCLLCLIISTVIIWIVNKLPFGKYISG